MSYNAIQHIYICVCVYVYIYTNLYSATQFNTIKILDSTVQYNIRI